MKQAPIDPDDNARAGLLASLALLDSPPEEVFDRITRLTAKVLDVPIALVSLIDKDRQWFKSRTGLDATETPREVSFCAHAVAAREPLVVRNALQDERFADNPLVLGAPFIRFYAGVPVYASSGVALGTLCAIGRQPRQFTDEELLLLTDLGHMVEREIAHRESTRVARRLVNHSDQLVRASESRLDATFEQAAVGMALVGLDGGWQRVNQRLCEIVGYTEAELMRLTFQDITHPSDLAPDMQLVQQLLAGEIPHYSLEKRYVRKDGQIVWINLTVTLIRNEDDSPAYFSSVIEDIQQRKAAEQALASLTQRLELLVQERTRELQQAHDHLAVALQQGKLTERTLATREAELVAILRNAPDAYISMDEGGRITEWNHQAELILGWGRAEVLGQPLHELIIPPDYREAHLHGMRRYLKSGVGSIMNQRIELTALRRDGSQMPVEIRVSALPSERGKLFCAFLHDITERKTLQASLLMQALRDPLTGLPNRRALNERLPQALARATRSGKALALLFMDLDGFKGINDRFGHQQGDQLLMAFSQRLGDCIRRSDTLARLAGDEFVALLEGLADPVKDPMAVAEKILAHTLQPFALEDGEGRIGISIGIAVYHPGQALDAEALLKAADDGMYRAKAAGKGRICLVDTTP